MKIADEVRLENKASAIQDQVNDLQKQKEHLEQEIEAKKTEYNLYMSTRDSDTKRQREELLLDQAKHNQQKKEFLEILNSVKQEKDVIEAKKLDLDNEKRKTVAARGNVEQFIISVQRAFSLLGS